MPRKLNILFQLMQVYGYSYRYFAKIRIQLSFEFMVYLAVAISSITAGIGMLIHFHSTAFSLSNKIDLENFALLINNNIGQVGTFQAIIPQGLCSARPENTISQLKALVSASAIVIDSNDLCNGSKPFGTVELNYLSNGSIEIR